MALLDIPTLETECLLSRGFEQRDVGPYAEMLSNPDGSEFLSTGAPLSAHEYARRAGD